MSAFARPLDAHAPDAQTRAEKAMEANLWKSMIKASGVFGKGTGWEGMAADAFSEAIADAVGNSGPSLMPKSGPSTGAAQQPAAHKLPPALASTKHLQHAHPHSTAIAGGAAHAAIADVLSLVEGNAHISSRYGPRADPLGKGHRHHDGVDIAAPAGSAIKAAAEGVVTWAGPRGGYGNLVEIRHSDGTRTRYAHARALHVKKGQRIQPGEVIAEVGATGRATGPHLHFEVRAGKSAINPERALKAYTPSVDSHGEHGFSTLGDR